jgi:hypothetical protein
LRQAFCSKGLPNEDDVDDDDDDDVVDYFDVLL